MNETRTTEITRPFHFAIPAADGQRAILCQPVWPGTVVRAERQAAGSEYLVECVPMEGAFTGGRSVLTVGVRVFGSPEGWSRQWVTGGYRHNAGTDLEEALRAAVERVSDVFHSDHQR